MPPIPDFLKRTSAPAEVSLPQFGMAQPGEPPAGVASALDQAFQLRDNGRLY